MIRRLAPLGVLVALFGLWLGWPRPPLDLSEALARVADHHAAETGGDPQDCAGRPSARAGVELVVSCQLGDRQLVYSVDARGRILSTSRIGVPAS